MQEGAKKRKTPYATEIIRKFFQLFSAKGLTLPIGGAKMLANLNITKTTAMKTVGMTDFTESCRVVRGNSLSFQMTHPFWVGGPKGYAE